MILVIIACLATNMTECKDFYIEDINGELGSQYQCLRMSPAHIAKWSETHPNYVVKRWTCVPKTKIYREA